MNRLTKILAGLTMTTLLTATQVFALTVAQENKLTNRPFQPGNSIGPVLSASYETNGQCWSGTLGGFVNVCGYLPPPNQNQCITMMMSNQHVLDGSINLPEVLEFPEGSGITQAGPADLKMPIVNGKQTKTIFGSTVCNPALLTQNTVAVTQARVPLNVLYNDVDASVASVINAAQANPAINGIGEVSTALGVPKVGMLVQYSGWSGLHNKAKIVRTNGAGNFCDSTNSNCEYMIHQIIFNVDPNFGDSGAWLVTRNTTCPLVVGMIFGRYAGYGYANDITNVFDELQVSLSAAANNIVSMTPEGNASCAPSITAADFDSGLMPDDYMMALVGQWVDQNGLSFVQQGNATFAYYHPNAGFEALHEISLGEDANGEPVMYWRFDPSVKTVDPGFVGIAPYKSGEPISDPNNPNSWDWIPVVVEYGAANDAMIGMPNLGGGN